MYVWGSLTWWLFCICCLQITGIDEDDVVVPEGGDASTEDMPPLEGEEDDDASRMEEVD